VRISIAVFQAEPRRLLTALERSTIVHAVETV
jgi:hypothetical protein